MIRKEDDLYPIHRTLTEAQPAPIVDVVGGGITYYGHAPLGTRQSDAAWKVIRVKVTGGITITEYAGGDMRYDSIWNDRATLLYSR